MYVDNASNIQIRNEAYKFQVINIKNIIIF